MSYCIDFFHKFKKEGNFCGLDKSQVSRLTAYLEIVELLMKQQLDEELIISNFSAGAAVPLIAAKDKAREDGLNYVTARLKRGEKVTAGDLKGSIKSIGSVREKLLISNQKPQTAPEMPKEPQIVKEVATNTKPPLLVEKPIQTAWNCGVAPCPDGQDHIEIEKIRGKVCGLLSLPCDQIRKERCPVITPQEQAKVSGSVPTPDIDPHTGGKIIRRGLPWTIVKKPEIIHFEPARQQWDFIQRAIKSGKFDKPEDVLSMALDRWMDQEGA